MAFGIFGLAGSFGPSPSAASGSFKVLHVFTGSSLPPFAKALIADSAGNLYGTAPRFSGSVVFKLTPGGTYTVLHAFGGNSPSIAGREVVGSLTIDRKGNLFGTEGKSAGFFQGYGSGVIFKVSPPGTYSSLYSFCSKPNCSDGEVPLGGLINDSRGNLFGTTSFGGGGGCRGRNSGCGVVYELTGAGFVPQTASSPRAAS